MSWRDYLPVFKKTIDAAVAEAAEQRAREINAVARSYDKQMAALKERHKLELSRNSATAEEVVSRLFDIQWERRAPDTFTVQLLFSYHMMALARTPEQRTRFHEFLATIVAKKLMETAFVPAPYDITYAPCPELRIATEKTNGK